jgi:hypothetical protein
MRTQQEELQKLIENLKKRNREIEINAEYNRFARDILLVKFRTKV